VRTVERSAQGKKAEKAQAYAETGNVHSSAETVPGSCDQQCPEDDNQREGGGICVI
jgi:hypothetical protein